MFKTLQSTVPMDKDMPARCHTLTVLSKVLWGQLYDHLPNAFHDEKNRAGEYIQLRNRRPCVRYGLCRLVVDDSVSLLFSEGHFPQIECDDKPTKEALEAIVKEVKLNEKMIDAATRGSVGSVAILLRVLKKRVFIDVMTTECLTPTWNPDAPDTLLKVTEKYKVKGAALVEQGYTIADDEQAADFWFQRVWDAKAETWYLPWLVSDKKAEPREDATKTVKHDLGFVPMVWIKNLPGGDDIDGAPTFNSDAIETSIELDYQLSQAGRGLKYSSDPTLLLKEPAVGQNGEIIKGAGNAIVVGPDGDAKMLEINGSAVDAVINYVKLLREFALESMHGNRANADKVSAAQSGRAMELMNQALIWLADRLRISYGEGALLELLRMIVLASQKYPLTLKDGTVLGEKTIPIIGKMVLKKDSPISLRWPAWYQPTASDAQSKAGTLTTLIKGGVISEETATKAISADYDIEDEAAERKLIEAERAKREANADKSVKISE